MWNGKFITFTDQDYEGGRTTMIYQAVETAPRSLTVVGSTQLYFGCVSGYYVEVIRPFIVGKKNTPANREQGTAVVGGNLSCENMFEYWTYPAGNFTSALGSAPGEPYGQSVSIVR